MMVMALYYIKENLDLSEERKKNARSKARADVEGILDQLGYRPINVPASSVERTISKHLDVARKWKAALDFLNSGDILAIQFPIINHSVLLVFILRDLKKRGVVTVLITHDIETLRLARVGGGKARWKIRRLLEEVGAMKTAGAIIVHNDRMKERLCRFGVSEDRMTSLGIFDYLIPGSAEEDLICRDSRTDPVIIAGNLERKKCGYLYALPDCREYNLYGIGYEDQRKKWIHYFGSFTPEELPLILRGSFGLIWDGEAADTCTGVFGEYLKINNPHKTSLYLASGHPVIVWSQSAMADFVLTNEVGIAVDSLYDLDEAIGKVSEEEYARMCRNAEEISRKLRSGFYLSTALKKAIAKAAMSDLR